MTGITCQLSLNSVWRKLFSHHGTTWKVTRTCPPFKRERSHPPPSPRRPVSLPRPQRTLTLYSAGEMGFRLLAAFSPYLIVQTYQSWCSFSRPTALDSRADRSHRWQNALVCRSPSTPCKGCGRGPERMKKATAAVET